MIKVKTSMRLPADIVEQMDELARRGSTSRTAILIQIYLDWKRLRAKQHAEQLPLAVDIPDEDELAEESPDAQMKTHGCGPLPLVEA